jgi:hypothetical protein
MALDQIKECDGDSLQIRLGVGVFGCGSHPVRPLPAFGIGPDYFFLSFFIFWQAKKKLSGSDSGRSVGRCRVGVI